MTAAYEVTQSTAHGANGKFIDVYCPRTEEDAAVPLVVLWHGIGPDERDVLRPLAEETARHGVGVVVPDWRSDAEDGGRRHLLDSLHFAAEQAPAFGCDTGRIVLAGWSAGAPAAMGVLLHPELLDGWRPRAAVGIAGRYDLTARTSGTCPLDDLALTGGPLPAIWLVHGAADDLMEGRHSHDFASALRRSGTPVHLEEPDTDHAGVIMTAFDPDEQRCRPTTSESALQGGRLTARVLARAAGIDAAAPSPSGSGR